jgi:translation initiation factor IF-3
MEETVRNRRPPRREVDHTPRNDTIRADKVRLIAEDGEQRGIVPLAEALAYAEEQGLDLVQVGSSNPVVCRLMDYSKHRYEQKRHEREAKRHSAKQRLKILKLHVKIASHDLETKIKHAREFLEHGESVQVQVVFRGREQTHPELAERILGQVTGALAEAGHALAKPNREGRVMSITIAPGLGKAAKAA